MPLAEVEARPKKSIGAVETPIKARPAAHHQCSLTCVAEEDIHDWAPGLGEHVAPPPALLRGCWKQLRVRVLQLDIAVGYIHGSSATPASWCRAPVGKAVEFFVCRI